MKIFHALFALLFLGATVLPAQSFDIEHLYPIEASHSFVQFEVTYMGYAKVKGNFSNFYGSIYYNPDAPNQTSVTFQIDVESIDTNNDWRDNDLKSGNWFLVEEYPHIRFSSSQVKKAGDEFLVIGDLTIKETTRQIEFRMPPPIGVVNDIRGDDQVIFTGRYTLNRKEYGVMGKNWSQVKEGIAALSDEVAIEFSLLGKQYNHSNFSNFLRNTKSPHGSIYNAYKEGGLEAAIEQYDALLAKPEIVVDSRALNMVGYMLLMMEQYDDALTLMLRNQAEYPEDSNVHDSLGELYAKMEKWDKSRIHYQKSLELDNKNMNAKEALRHLR